MTEAEEIRCLKQEVAHLRLYAPARRTEPSQAIVKGLERAEADFAFWGIEIETEAV